MAIEPIRIELNEVGKKYGREWVLNNLSRQLHSGSRYGISGRNGSGKSTLLRILSGQLSPSRGLVSYFAGGARVPVNAWYAYVSWTGPYLEVVEELTIQEALRFHFALKPLRAPLTVEEVVDRIDLRPFRQRKLSDCSSGMRQRVILATAIYGASPLILLDEPSLTLDETAAAWLQNELRQFTPDRLLVIASNEGRDLAGCDAVIEL
jgi:ABC-type multidrug transport system ATPase subunit